MKSVLHLLGKQHWSRMVTVRFITSWEARVKHRMSTYLQSLVLASQGTEVPSLTMSQHHDSQLGAVKSNVLSLLRSQPYKVEYIKCTLQGVIFCNQFATVCKSVIFGIQPGNESLLPLCPGKDDRGATGASQGGVTVTNQDKITAVRCGSYERVDSEHPNVGSVLRGELNGKEKQAFCEGRSGLHHRNHREHAQQQ